MKKYCKKYSKKYSKTILWKYFKKYLCLWIRHFLWRFMCFLTCTKMADWLIQRIFYFPFSQSLLQVFLIHLCFLLFVWWWKIGGKWIETFLQFFMCSCFSCYLSCLSLYRFIIKYLLVILVVLQCMTNEFAFFYLNSNSYFFLICSFP